MESIAFVLLLGCILLIVINILIVQATLKVYDKLGKLCEDQHNLTKSYIESFCKILNSKGEVKEDGMGI